VITPAGGTVHVARSPVWLGSRWVGLRRIRCSPALHRGARPR